VLAKEERRAVPNFSGKKHCWLDMVAPLHNTHRLVNGTCVRPSEHKEVRKVPDHLALALPTSFRGVTTFSQLNCFAPSSLITQSLPPSPNSIAQCVGARNSILLRAQISKPTRLQQ
jgi:hypothetical protein